MVLNGLRDYSKSYWPLSWSVIGSAMEFGTAKVWLKDNVQSKYNVYPSYKGCIIAFENINDSIKFKLFNQ